MLSSKNLLFAEKPYVTVVDIEIMKPRNMCWSCLKVGKCLICSNCKIAAYCSKECQNEDWVATKQHKHECEVFQKMDKADRQHMFRKSSGTMTVRFIGRLLARKLEDGGIQPEQDRFKFPKNAVVKTLVDVPTGSYGGSGHLSGRSEILRSIPGLFNKFYRKKSTFYSKVSNEDIRYAISLSLRRLEIRREVDGITDVAKLGSEMVGVSLFMQMSRFRYSCDPDVVRIEENGISYFKLLKPEKQNMDLDQLTIGNHINELEPKIDLSTFKPFMEEGRYQVLLDQECAYCNDEAGLKIRHFSIKEKCPDCGDSLVYYPKHPPAKCFKCQSLKLISSATKSAVKSALKWQNRYTKEKLIMEVSDETYFNEMKASFDIFDPVRCIHLQDDLIGLLYYAKERGVLNAKYCGCVYSFDEKCFIRCPSALACGGCDDDRHVSFAALIQVAAALDPDRSLVKKWADRYRPGLNLEYLLPVMEVVRKGMAFHDLCLYDAIPVKEIMCDVYARAGLFLEAMEIAVDARETMVLCYYEGHPKVKEWDARLQELSRAK